MNDTPAEREGADEQVAPLDFDVEFPFMTGSSTGGIAERMADIFISYAREDVETARRFAECSVKPLLRLVGRRAAIRRGVRRKH